MPPRRRSTRQRPETPPEPAPTQAPSSNSEPNPEPQPPTRTTKKRSATSAAKSQPKKKQKRDISSADDADSHHGQTPVDSEPVKNTKKTPRATGKKDASSKETSNGTKAKAKGSNGNGKTTKSKTKDSDDDDDTVTKKKGTKASDKDKASKTTTKAGTPKKDSKVTKKGARNTKKAAKDVEETEGTKEASATSTKDTKAKSNASRSTSEEPKEIYHDSQSEPREPESESHYDSKSTNTTPAKESSDTTPPPDSDASATVPTDFEKSDDNQTDNEPKAVDTGTEVQEPEPDSNDSQLVSPLPTDPEEGETELETEIDLSLNNSESNGQRKAREQGDTPYQDHTVHPNTFLFLQDLKNNNNREWLKENYLDYKQAKDDWESFIGTLTEKVRKHDRMIPNLPARDMVVRIQKDNRSCKDQTEPYKTYFSAVWSPTRKNCNNASYHIRLEPGSCYVGSGFSCNPFTPQDRLARLRQDISENPYRLKSILREPGMRREFLGGLDGKEEDAEDAFVNVRENKESAVKSHPKGYASDHEQIQLLRLRTFHVGKHLPDSLFSDADAQDQIAALVGVMRPFVGYLNSLLELDI